MWGPDCLSDSAKEPPSWQEGPHLCPLLRLRDQTAAEIAKKAWGGLIPAQLHH